VDRFAQNLCRRCGEKCPVQCRNLRARQMCFIVCEGRTGDGPTIRSACVVLCLVGGCRANVSRSGSADAGRLPSPGGPSHPCPLKGSGATMAATGLLPAVDVDLLRRACETPPPPDLSPAEFKRATRAVKEFSIAGIAPDRQLNLYVQMKKLFGSGSRISKRQFEQWTSSVRLSTAMKKMLVGGPRSPSCRAVQERRDP